MQLTACPAPQQLCCLCAAFFITLDTDEKDARPGDSFLFFISTLNAAWWPMP